MNENNKANEVMRLQANCIDKAALFKGIEGLMTHLGPPTTKEAVQALYEDKTFCLGVLSGLLMLPHHKQTPQELTDPVSNSHVLSMLSRCSKAAGLNSHLEKKEVPNVNQ